MKTFYTLFLFSIAFSAFAAEIRVRYPDGKDYVMEVTKEKPQEVKMQESGVICHGQVMAEKNSKKSYSLICEKDSFKVMHLLSCDSQNPNLLAAPFTLEADKKIYTFLFRCK